MPRKRTAVADPDFVLARIVAAYDELKASLEKRLADIPAELDAAKAAWAARPRHYPGEIGRQTFDLEREQRRVVEQLAALADYGIAYDLLQIAGQPLTDSQRVMWGRSIRRLFDRYFVDLTGKRATSVKPTGLGRAHLAALQQQGAASE